LPRRAPGGAKSAIIRTGQEYVNFFQVQGFSQISTLSVRHAKNNAAPQTSAAEPKVIKPPPAFQV
jgi:hypothetical protein